MSALPIRSGSVRAVGLCGVALALASLFVHPASGSDVTGSAGTDTALPLTDSAVTVTGRGRFADLEITVNQTRNLLNQAVSITWEGGAPTLQTDAAFSGNYLQIMQCWGDPDGTNPENPGPPPEQCAFGATNGVYGGVPGNGFPTGSLATERIVSRRGWPNFRDVTGTLDEVTGNVWRDFVAVDGTRVGNHIDPRFNPSAEGGVYWQNTFFNVVTTNEIAGARTLSNGTGAEFFEVVTGVENRGLGCGQQVQPVAGTDQKQIPRCWIVVVPRADPATENAGTPFGVEGGVVTSPLAPDQWQHRIAIPIEFNPVDTACRIGADETRIVGNELIGAAIASWQPVLCAMAGRRPYSYAVVSDSLARQQLVADAPGSAGMYAFSRPLDAEVDDPANPTVYAPLTISGLTVGFNVERSPGLEADEDARRLQGLRIARINLTPRLLAKLLTQSYARQVNIKNPPSPEWEDANPPYRYDWLDENPDHLGQDEDFLRFNPEFREHEIIWRREFSGLLVPAGNADAASLVWAYILSDPEARKWLDGERDEWGMQVNPLYATRPDRNTLGVPFAEEPPPNFPKSDPYCYQAPDTPQGVTPPLLCGTDWNPYTQSLREGARLARSASTGARLEENSYAISADRYYSRTPPQPSGRRAVLSLTDTPSANLFGLQTASLSRPGDDGDERTFIAPDTESLTAGVEAMTPRGEPDVLEPDLEADANAAYPLTVLTYAATRPLTLEDAERTEYAAFVEFVTGAGQTSGPRYGELPVGYAPLPDELTAQAAAAAVAIREMEPGQEPEPEPAPDPDPEPGPEQPEPEQPTTSPPPPATGGVPSPPGTRTGPRGVAGDAPDSPSPPAPAVDASVPEVPVSPTTTVVAQLASTPGIDVPPSRFAIAGLAGLAVSAALLALEITKRPRRSPGPSPASPGARASSTTPRETP